MRALYHLKIEMIYETELMPLQKQESPLQGHNSLFFIRHNNRVI